VGTSPYSATAKNVAGSTSYEFLIGILDEEDAMKWSKPVVREYCVGMEVTSYDSAEIDPLF
jgi:coenzyme PQQ precursor peptide PqqA